jgi:hypothetical protein
VAAYQQAPSSQVPFIINLKQSGDLIVSVPISAYRPTINTCHLSALELKMAGGFFITLLACK